MDKELIIFGAGGALGKGVTSSLTKKDYSKIYLFDSKPADISQNNNIQYYISNDLSSEENVINAFNNIKPSKDKLYFLISTVGGFSGGKYIWETDQKEWDRMFSQNLSTSFLIAKHFANLIKQSAGGSIIFISAFTALYPEKLKASYGASKAALIHLVKTLALEGEEIHMTANAIAPFIIDTPLNREWIKEDYNKLIKPEEIGELIYGIFCNFNFVTGNIIQLSNRFQIE